MYSECVSFSISYPACNAHAPYFHLWPARLYHIFPQDANLHSSFISGKVFYMFRAASPPIIRSTHKCIYSIWYLLNCNG